MAQCMMTLADDRRCNETIYQCGFCGASGCKNDDCRNQTFDGMRCLACGANGATAFTYKPGR